jgi:hypothetical protein
MAAVPVLGFREWVLRSGVLVSSVRGEPWPAPVMQASCAEGHQAPADGCGCGVYAIDEWPRFGDSRLYEQAAAPMRLFAGAMLTLLLAGGAVMTALLDQPLLAHGHWVPALGFTGAALLGLISIAWAERALARPPYLLGGVVLTGRVLHYDNGVMRAEHARIGCLIRPLGVSRKQARRAADRLGVPLFDWRERQRALRYLSEHGDLWQRRSSVRGGRDPPLADPVSSSEGSPTARPNERCKRWSGAVNCSLPHQS